MWFTVFEFGRVSKSRQWTMILVFGKSNKGTDTF